MTEQNTEEVEDVDEDEQPEIDEEEKAGIEIDVDPDDIEDEAGQSDQEDANESDQEETDAAESFASGGPTGDSWGDMYCEGLATVATVIKEEAGNGDPVSAERARELHLDEYFDEFVRSKGKSENMPPEQALLVATCLFLLGTLATDSELLETTVSEVTMQS